MTPTSVTKYDYKLMTNSIKKKEQKLSHKHMYTLRHNRKLGQQLLLIGLQRKIESN